MQIRAIPGPCPNHLKSRDMWAVRMIWCWLIGIPLLVLLTIVQGSIEATVRPLNAEIKALTQTNESLWLLLQDRDCFLAWQEPRLRQVGLGALAADSEALDGSLRNHCREWPENDDLVLSDSEVAD